MRFIFAIPALAFACALLDCASLPSIPSNTCGNGVVEQGEDCDTFPAGQCRAAGQTFQCRLDCTTTACPSGWGCSTEGICRAPSGSFQKASEPIAAGAWRVSVGDIDGDHRQDVLSRSPPDFGGFSKLRVHFFDGTGALAKAIIIPPALGSAHLIDTDGDGLDDISFSAPNGVGTFLGRSDRTLAPVPYAASTLDGIAARLYPITGFPGKRTTFVAFVSDGKNNVLQTQEGATTLMTLAQGPDAIAGDVAVATLFPKSSPCEELVFAFPNDTSVQVFPVCKGTGAAATWNASGAPIVITLPGPAKVDNNGVRTADLDGDGNLDVMIGATAGPKQQTYVAYGDGVGAFHPRPGGGIANQAGLFTIATTTLGEAYSPLLPLAVGDISGDGQPDFLTPDQLLTSQTTAATGDGGAGVVVYFSAATKAGQHSTWSQAAIADFNGNGFPDVIAATKDALDLDFFSGTGTQWVNTFSIATQGTPRHFSVGDADGDLLPDLIFADATTAADQLAILWGQVGGSPQTPTEVGLFQQIDQTIYFVTTDAALQHPQAALAVVSQPVDPKAKLSTEFAVLSATGDRQPLALRELIDGTARGSPLLAAIPGSFAGGTADIAALAYDAASNGTTLTAWLLSGKELANVSAGPSLPAALTPFFAINKSAGLALLTAAGKFVGDATAELALVAPIGVTDGSKSILIVAAPKPKDGGGFTFDLLSQVPLDLPSSQEGQLEPLDVDKDGALDLVLLTGNNVGQRSIVVLWNDGHGNFDPARSSVVAQGSSPTSDDNPQGFGTATVATSGPPALAFVTRGAVFLAEVDPAARTFKRDRVAVLKGANGTGVAGGDIDGDGVDDLVVADSGNLVIIRGQAVLP